MKDLSKETIILKGGMENRLYQLPRSFSTRRSNLVQLRSYVQVVKNNTILPTMQDIQCNNTFVDGSLWYCCLGHHHLGVLYKVLLENSMHIKIDTLSKVYGSCKLNKPIDFHSIM